MTCTNWQYYKIDRFVHLIISYTFMPRQIYVYINIKMLFNTIPVADKSVPLKLSRSAAPCLSSPLEASLSSSVIASACFGATLVWGHKTCLCEWLHVSGVKSPHVKRTSVLCTPVLLDARDALEKTVGINTPKPLTCLCLELNYLNCTF